MLPRLTLLVLAATLSLASSSTRHARHASPSSPPPAGSSTPAWTSSPPPSPAPARGATAGDALQFCVDETNRLRAQHGKPPVARSARLEAYAAEGAREDHASRTAHGHFSRTGGGGFSFAENECPGWGGWSLSDSGSVEGVMRSCFANMMAEGQPPPGSYNHFSNMLGNHAAVGCGVYIAPDGAVTVVQDFGEAG